MGSKVVLITGATGAIGRATAIAFGKTGEYDLALHYNTAGEDVRKQLLTSIEESCGHLANANKVEFVQADLNDFDSVRRMHASVQKSLGNVDILFCNAGTSGEISSPSSLQQVSLDQFLSTWRVNVGAGVLLTQLCLAHMEIQGYGRIIFNSSIAAFTGGVVGPHYASSKSALHGLIHWLAKSVARQGITVNAVAPALIGGAAIISECKDEQVWSQAASRIPIGRLGKPEEIADTVMWMVKTGYLTSKIIAVDGGSFAH